MSPAISIVVIVHNMRREAPRTLFSLTSRYQVGVSDSDYEVIVVENGSPRPLGAETVQGFGPNFRYHFLSPAPPSPARAVNFGASLARGEFIGIMIDGARILSPGVLRHANLATGMYREPVISTLGWHLGPSVQAASVQKGYDRGVEDRLLAQAQWEQNGYRLFGISSFAGSSINGYFLPISESNCLFLRRETFAALGGFDERFDLPGGGLANLDFYKRACELPDTDLVIILGEGSFHQIHGGVTTNVTDMEVDRKWKEYEAQYRSIRGHGFAKPDKRPSYIGHVPPESLRFLQESVDRTRDRPKLIRRVRDSIRRFLKGRA